MAQNGGGKSSAWIIIIGVIIFFSLVGSCGNNSSSSSSSNRMSKEYNTNSEYRKSVDKTADAFGITSEEVDRKINAVADAAKNK